VADHARYFTPSGRRSRPRASRPTLRCCRTPKELRRVPTPGEASLRPPQGRRRRGDRLAVLHPARPEGRQGAAQGARSHPRRHHAYGLPAEPSDGCANWKIQRSSTKHRGGRTPPRLHLGKAVGPAGLFGRSSQLGPILIPNVRGGSCFACRGRYPLARPQAHGGP
jgi:hypothetical protein